MAGRVAVGLGLAWVGLAAWITASGMSTELRRVDCIIVLGARALADGTPGPSLTARLDRGVALWKEGWAPVLLCTGGPGQTGPVEGEVGRRYAIEHGVPAEAIAFEGQSHSTRENFRYAAEVMRERGWRTCLVVTDPFHEKRSLMLARDFGLEAYPAPTFSGPGWRHWGVWAFYTARETLSVTKYAWERLKQ